MIGRVADAGGMLHAACELLDVLNRDSRADASLADRGFEGNRGGVMEFVTQRADVR